MGGTSQTSEIIVSMLAGILFFSLLAGFIIYFMFLYRQKQLLHQEEQKRLQAQYQQAILESQMEIQGEILQHVSSEIHDNLGQIASLLKIQLYTLPVDKDSPAGEKLAESKELLAKLILDLKTLSVSLNTDYVSEAGLVATLRKETQRIQKLGTVTVSFETNAEQLPLDAGKTVFLYRMAQEILNNMLKHAQAKHIHIQLTLEERTLTVQMEDDGTGFDVETALARSLQNENSGLRNLKKRCDLMHGNLEIIGLPGQGSKFVITLPV